MDVDQARQRLDEERNRLLALREEVDGARDEAEEESLGELSHYDQHQADVGTETFNRERDLSILSEIEGELTAVEHALQRIDDGTYGICEACGKPIGDERLEAMPATRLCVEDQQKAERERGAPREATEEE